MNNLPRIKSGKLIHIWPNMLIEWQDGEHTSVNLGGWIMTGGDVLAPLKDRELFAQAAVGEYGASIYWGDPDGDLAIDALHLRKLADEQRPFLPSDLVQWQQNIGLSNQEAADFFAVALSTWNTWKSGDSIPSMIGMICRASERDPVLMQAHYKPRRSGRPRAREAAA